LRNDPFFFNEAGFAHTAATIHQTYATFGRDTGGCPAIDPASEMLLMNSLKSNATGGSPTDAYARQNILALVVEVDRAVLTAQPVVGVWASTNRVGP
jgi:hypothetical protein